MKLASTVVVASITVSMLAPPFSGAAPAQDVAADRDPVIEGPLGTELDRYLRGLEGFGYSGAALVAKDGRVVLRQGYGEADRSSRRPVDPSTVFTTGSITKQFTGAAIMRLEMADALSVDDPIIDYFDGVPPDKQSITIHQLLTHSAGFPGAIGDDFGDDTRTEFLESALDAELLFAPGSRYEYSNVGYSLAAIIVEIVSGKSYEEFLTEELFEPAGMMRTGYTLPRFEPDEVAVGYRGDRRWGTFLERPSYVAGPSWHLKGNGGIQSTVNDMYRWHLALEGDEILSASAKEKYFARHIDEGFGDTWYGYGWVTRETPRGTRVITHNGGNSVFSADFHRYVDDDVVIYATAASSEFFIDPISETLAAIVFGEDYTMPPLVMDWAEVREDPAVLDDYVGVYRLDPASTISVRREKNHLRLSASGANARNLLVGGAGGVPDEAIDALSARTAAIATRWVGGDARGIHEAMVGRRSLEELEAALDQFRTMREDQFGSLQSIEVGNVLPEGDGYAAYVGMRHVDGRGWAVFHWQDGRLAAIEPVRDLPRPASDVYPVARLDFVSFDLRSPVRVELSFDNIMDSWLLIFTTPTGQVRLPRDE